MAACGGMALSGVLATAAFSAAHAFPPAPAILSSAIPPALSAPVERVAVFGVDNRKRLPKHLGGLRDSIGLIYNERTRTVCSAFCVADDIIGTASHCVFRTKGETPPPPEKFFFARPNTRHASIRFAGAAQKSSAQQIITGTVGISTKPPIEAARDWAFVRLQGPACRGAVLPIATMTPGDIEKEAKAGRLFQAAFHRDYGRWSMAYSDPCAAGNHLEGANPNVTARDFADPLNLVLHQCDTGGASSGSPLLVESPAGPRVVAINVGTFVQSRVVLQGGEVVSRAPASPVANTAVSATAFADKVPHLRQASILTSTDDLRTLQNLLASQALYEGSANGRYDNHLRQAVEQFERREGMAVTGLPTRSLLEALSRGIPTR